MEDEWISVEDEKPNFGDLVIVFGSKYNGAVSRKGVKVGFRDRIDEGGEHWQVINYRAEETQEWFSVLYWKPLPKPPE